VATVGVGSMGADGTPSVTGAPSGVDPPMAEEAGSFGSEVRAIAASVGDALIAPPPVYPTSGVSTGASADSTSASSGIISTSASPTSSGGAITACP